MHSRHRAAVQEISFRSCAFTGGHKVQHHIKELKRGVDVAVCTPGRLFQLRQRSHLRLDSCLVRTLFMPAWRIYLARAILF